MNVLVVVKTTNYELHGAAMEAKVEHGLVSQEAVARLKRAHEEHYACLNALRATLAKYKVDYKEVSRDESWHHDQSFDAVISVGGDGTLLSASHKLLNGEVLIGLRSSWSSVGYLCCAGPDHIDETIKSLAEGSSQTIRVERLCAVVSRLEGEVVLTTAPVLNDFLYSNANPAATTRYKIQVGSAEEVHRSSGIWVATGAGSSAAITAAGGERRPIDDRLFQYKVRELYRLGHVTPKIDAGFFDPDQEQVRIENRCQSAILALDGQHGIINLAYGDIISFTRASPLNLVTPWRQRSPSS